MAADTIAQRLAANAAGHPERIAIEDGRGTITYADLDASVDRVAGHLDSVFGSVPPGRRGRPMVGVLTSRARDVALVSFAAARAGVVTVCIDPAAPPDRMEAIVADAGIDLVLTGGGLHWDGGTDIEEAGSARAIGQPVDVLPDDLSAILYTSGSTGIPKGVRFSHRARLAAVQVLPVDTTGAGIRACGTDAGSIGVAEINHVGPIVRGGTLLPFAVQEHGLAALPSFMREHRANSLRGVPTMVRKVLSLVPPGDPLLELRAVQMFGEPVTGEDIAALRAALPPDARIYNGYGSTEAGVLTNYVADPEGHERGALPAGWPVDGVELLVLDDDDELVDHGVPGHIVAAGPGLPDGYWNRAGEDARTFRRLDDGVVLVRTGDRGVVTPDGCLVVHGRSDDVVKIAGHRVELGEVVVALSGLPRVHAAAAAAKPDRRGDLRLLGYVVPEPGATLDGALLRAAAARRLPRAMLPDVVMILDELPELPNGKVDRSALPDRVRRVPSDVGDDLESEVRRIFSEVLDRDMAEVGPDDDFFDLGGDSLRALELLVALEDVAGLRLSPERLVEATTPAAMATAIGSDHHLDPSGCVIPVRPAGERPPLMFVPGADGQPWGARRLARHLPDGQPVYVAQPPETRGEGSSWRTVEEAAATYVDALRTIEPTGPYHLVGGSAGGLVAFEMARQLHRAGAEIGVVVLGDTAPPGDWRSPELSPSVIDWARRRQALTWAEVPIAARSDARRVVDRLRSRGTRSPRPSNPEGGRWNEEALRWRQRVNRSALDIVQSYRPRPYAGRVVLLHCGGTARRQIDVWRPLCPGGLDVYEIAAPHDGLFVEPALAEVSAIIERVTTDPPPMRGTVVHTPSSSE